jgi:trans-aconitate methyltransferase
MDGNLAEYYDEIYTDDASKWSADYRDAMLHFVLSKHTEEPESLIDVGCGNGHTIEYLQKEWPNTKYYGVDLSDTAIQIAKEKVPDAVFVSGDYKEILQKWNADVVVSMGVAEHFKNPVDFLSDMQNMGKLIYLEVPNCLYIGWALNQTEAFRQTDGKTGQVEWHLIRSTWEIIITMAGLEIVRKYKGATVETEFIWMLK